MADIKTIELDFETTGAEEKLQSLKERAEEVKKLIDEIAVGAESTAKTLRELAKFMDEM